MFSIKDKQHLQDWAALQELFDFNLYFINWFVSQIVSFPQHMNYIIRNEFHELFAL